MPIIPKSAGVSILAKIIIDKKLTPFWPNCEIKFQINAPLNPITEKLLFYSEKEYFIPFAGLYKRIFKQATAIFMKYISAKDNFIL